MNGHTAAHNVQAVVSTNVPVIYPMPGPPVFQFFRRIMRMVFKTIREDERVDPADIPRLFGRTAVEDSMRLDLDNFIVCFFASIAGRVLRMTLTVVRSCHCGTDAWPAAFTPAKSILVLTYDAHVSSSIALCGNGE